MHRSPHRDAHALLRDVMTMVGESGLANHVADVRDEPSNVHMTQLPLMPTSDHQS
jgi:hypothetical protein